MPEYAITSVTDSPAVYCPVDEVAVKVLVNKGELEILPTDRLGSSPVPRPLIKVGSIQRYITMPSVVVITEQGGRGPIFNEGQPITAGVLLQLLTDAIDEGELAPALRARLDAFTSAINNLIQDVDDIDANLADNSDIVTIVNQQLESAVLQTKDPQEGFAAHNTTTVLDFLWSTPPLIDLVPCHGITVKQIEDQTDPDVHYVEIPDQELVYGHTGVIETGTPGQYQFTTKAAIVAYVAPYLNNILWTSADIIGSELLGLEKNSGASPIQSTNVPCMGFEVKGYLVLRNSGGTKVKGTAYVQMAVDGGSWVTIARFKKLFQAAETTAVQKSFHVMTADDQASHTYQFRVKLVVDPTGDVNRELTASIHVATVAESGAGTVLTNNDKLKWAAKE